MKFKQPEWAISFFNILRNNIEKISWALIMLGSLFTVWLLVSLSFFGFWVWGKGSLNMEATGQVGDFVGGFVGTIISAAGFLFLYLNLKEQRITTTNQRESSIIQNESFAKERLESKFFDLIKMHRDNVSELKMRSTKIIEQDDSYIFNVFEEDGKAVFKDIFYQIIDCLNELKPFFHKLDRIYTVDYRNELEANPNIHDKLLLALIAKIDICYSIVYYGVGSEGLITLYKIFEKKYKNKFITDILNYISLKPANDLIILEKWSKLNKRGSRQTKINIVNEILRWRREKSRLSSIDPDCDITIEELSINYHNRYIKYYGGHQFRLGHYFRHLYQSVKFINNQSILNYSEKYSHVKILRAQLSNYEQAVLFLNSLSSLGRSWELFPEVKNELNKEDIINFQLITKYNMIKNIPGDSLYGIPFRLFYQNVQFEGLQRLRDNSIYK
jgi:uncharacterized membrane protein